MSTIGQLVEGAKTGAGGGKKGDGSKPAPAPKKTGIFAQKGPLTDPLRQRVAESHNKVRQAEEKVPGRSLNIGRIPHGPLTPQTRKALIQHQEGVVKREVAHAGGAKSFEALQEGHGNSAASRDRAQQIHSLENLGDKQTRDALHELSGAQSTQHNLDLATKALGQKAKSLSTHALNVIGRYIHENGGDAPPPGMNAGDFEGTSKMHSKQSAANTLGVGGVPLLGTAANIGSKIAHTGAKINFALPLAAARAIGGPDNVVQHGVNDITDLAVGAVPSLYNLGDVALSQVGLGRGPQTGAEKLDALAKGLRDQTMLGRLATRGPGAALQQVGAHPVNSALELSGAEAAVGRGIGALGRSNLFGKRLAEVADTARTPKAVTGDVVDIRRFNPDVARKGGQVLADKVRELFGKDPNVATGAEAVKLARRQMSQTAGASEIARRDVRNAAGQVMKQMEPGSKHLSRSLPDLGGKAGVTEGRAAVNSILGKLPRALRVKGGKHSDLSALFAQKVIRSPETLVEDLHNYRAIVQDSLDKDAAITNRANPGQKGYLAPAQRRAGEHTIKAIDKALGDQKFLTNPHEYFAAGDAYSTLRGAVDTLKEELHVQSPKQTAARDLPGLIVHAGAERVDLPDEVVALQRDFQKASEALTKHSGNGDPYDLVSGLAQHADDLSKAIRAHGYDPEAMPSGWVIQGHPISIDDAQHLLHEIGADGAGFVSHNAANHGAAAYFNPSIKYPGAAMGPRTGNLLRSGAADASWQAMTDDLSGAMGTVEQARRFDRTARRFMTGDGDGNPFQGQNAWGLAQHAAEEMNHADPDVEMVPFNLSPLMDASGTLEDGAPTWGLGHSDTEAYKAAEELWNRVEQPRAGGPVALIPKAVLDDWKKLSVGVGGPKAMQMFLQNFKRTVLPFSTKWIAGNHVEGALRSLAYGHGPVDWWRAKKWEQVLEKHDAEHGTDYLHTWRSHTHGGHFSSIETNEIHRTIADLPKGTQTAAKVISTAVEPAMKLIRPLRDGILHLNAAMERETARAALGAKLQKDIRETAGGWGKAIRISQDTMERYLQGKLVDKHGNLDENQLVDMGRYLFETMGRYAAHSPMERAIVQTYLPFWDWYRNAMKFVFWTLPAKHPIKTALLVQLEEANKKELDAEGQHLDSTLPSFLLGGVKNQDGSFTDWSHYTPFGVAKDPVGTTWDVFAPQYKDVALAGAGVNWKLKQMKNNSGGPVTALDRLGAMLNTAAGSQVPLESTGERLREGAGTPTDLSNILSPHTKPGTKPGSLSEMLNKLYNPAYPKKPGGQEGAKKGGNGNGWGGSSRGGNGWG